MWLRAIGLPVTEEHLCVISKWYPNNSRQVPPIRVMWACFWEGWATVYHSVQIKLDREGPNGMPFFVVHIRELLWTYTEIVATVALSALLVICFR